MVYWGRRRAIRVPPKGKGFLEHVLSKKPLADDSPYHHTKSYAKLEKPGGWAGYRFSGAEGQHVYLVLGDQCLKIEHVRGSAADVAGIDKILNGLDTKRLGELLTSN